MRRFAVMCVLLLGTAGGAMAQGMPDGTPTRDGMAGGMNAARHGETRACMKEHLGDVRAQVRAGMKTFREANPTATPEDKKMERRRLMEPFRPQVMAAKEACGVAHRGAGFEHRPMGGETKGAMPQGSMTPNPMAAPE